ncbi:MAG: magnesium and cobalt transport protein CorA [Candidatus Brocadia sp.]|uniref:Magnesium transport protein CorA n=1 Tax=Candidatus Brocadia sinica JPN1 TaxID=1197129 RepID=A0ABQ0JY28_9BACT|nr:MULTISPECIES: magnesium/cobalt transporter CorA [Brocadia]KXK30003.1 MAG: magnesium and cobalt transporter protein [Candidatus Brocadia sinica]MBC6931445.1 magnesium and cobalt transport protein CorA [Candidatus Brocadia sp.]MBL1167499.1 magnesium and cobalt transport protein CorA [Candidatus Brocadia sp. AMX1]NOG40614.1 magnesium/cobalt transporter CorA [Planctomycetota bacterium]KAA0244174.1 MAG: magnesium and cobalt transport protein CorA [Candidatus Brocadia sp. AMX2]
MAKLIKKRSEKAGLLPDALIHIGERKTEKVKITITEYDEMHFHEQEAKAIEECFPFKDKGRPTIAWINIDGIHRSDILGRLGEGFGLHPLTVEDIMNIDQRPKIEDFKEYSYIALKMLQFSGKDGEVISEQVSLVLGSNFVISFQEREVDIFHVIRERIRTNKGRIRKMGADYLAYCLLDAIVDNYFIIMETLGEKIESLEDELVSNPTPVTLHAIYKLKMNTILLRRSVWPLREVIGGLERGESSLIRESTRIYYKDIHDHTLHIIDTLETFREMVAGMLEIYLSSISNRLNAVIKVLTMLATIFMPLTFIAGIYGMNFKYMPELEWRWGYPIILFIMAAVGIIMVYYFKKKRW